ncbi:hypothetical protein AN958_03387 [Leucoagaricus sp. SymC.cos]|nr:hypothetical protein AN958_03387 [Leucoagaricus sp. SymC.cos]
MSTVQSTHRDVEEVRELLLKRLPYELTDIIMVEAQYFARLSTKRTIHLTVQGSKEPLNNAKWLYLISKPIPEVYNGDHIVPTKVHSVRFSIKSCDQGWGGFSEDKNAYRNSYTWFEASILRPDEPSDPPPQWIIDAARKPINVNNLPGQGWTELSSPYRRRNKRWLLQMNAQASRHIRHHEIKWSRDSGENESAEYDEKTGSGRGLGFTRELQADDRIALVARALYPGWENNVYSAEIEVAYQT